MPIANAAREADPESERQAVDIIEALIRQARAKTAFAASAVLDHDELLSIEALIAYIAHTQKLPPESLQTLLAGSFAAADIAAIKRQDFQRAVEYLVNLQDSGSLN